jgi:hypothetical protein
MEVLMVSAVCRNPTRPRVGAGLALVLAGLVFALSAASSATAITLSPGVRVLDGNNNVLALFTSAKCSRPKPYYSFNAVAKSQGWTLDVTFWRDESQQFTNNHTFNVEFGPASAITVDVFAPDRSFYSTSYAPPNPPRSAGGLRFGPGGARIGIGLFAVLSPDIQTGVAIAGGLQCHYPRRR